MRINLISEDLLENMTSLEKIRMILDDVKTGNIVVLERGLTPEEHKILIEMTMNEIDAGFCGIEIESYPYKRSKFPFLSKLLGKSPLKGRLTVIGRGDMLQTIRKDHELISAVVIEPNSKKRRK